LVLPSEVVPLVVPVDELMQSEPVSSMVSDVALEISDTLGESLSIIHDWYFRDSDEVDRDLAEEHDRLREELRVQEEWDVAFIHKHRQELTSYIEEATFK
jgi:hypothetical protein